MNALRPLLAAALLAAPAAAQTTMFTANEVRATAVKDRLREMRGTLKDGTPRGKALSAAVTAVFKGEDDWGPAVENYYALRKELLERAATVEARLDKAMTANTMEGAEGARDKAAAPLKDADILRSDYELYVGLPARAYGTDRKAALAAMRLLSQSGKYPMALAYFLSKAKDRRPFSPLTPASALVRLPY